MASPASASLAAGAASFVEIPWGELEPLCGFGKELAGQGGAGTCYRGTVRGQDAAVKVFSIPAGPAGLDADAAFQRELRMLARLAGQSAVVVRLIGACTQGAAPNGRPTPRAVVTEYVAGGCLHDALLARRGGGGPPPAGKALLWAADVARGLLHLHAQSPPVAHLDIKPPNVLLRPDGAAVLCDFGISKTATTLAAVTTSSQSGTPAYKAPEQWAPRFGVPGPASDVWAFGCLLCDLGTGVPAWRGLSQEQIMTKVSDRGNGWKETPYVCERNSIF